MAFFVSTIVGITELDAAEALSVGTEQARRKRALCVAPLDWYGGGTAAAAAAAARALRHGTAVNEAAVE